MDPATATVAFLGFAASLATLVAVVIDTSKTIRDIGNRILHAPDDVRRLIFDFKIFEGLLQEIQTRVKEHGDTNVSQGLQELWAALAAQLQKDMEGFQSIVLKLSALFDSTYSPSNLIRLRIRHLVSETGVAKYRQQISAHYGSLMLVQTLISDQKLDNICQCLMDSIEMRKHGFEAAFSNVARIKQPSTFKHSREHLELGNSTVTVTENCSFKQGYVLPIGTLETEKTTRYIRSACPSIPQAYSESEIRFTFLPPLWLSSLAIRCSLSLRGYRLERETLGFRLRPLNINHNSSLLGAIKSFDITGLQRLLNAGQVHPTDYLPNDYGDHILHGRLVTLGVTVSLDHSFHDYMSIRQYKMLEFLGNSGFLVDSQIFRIFIMYQQDFFRLSQYKWIGTRDLKSYLRKFNDLFLASGAVVFGDSEQTSTLSKLVSGPLGFECMSDCLLGQMESWVLEDLASIDVWLIGIWSYANHAFRKQLEQHLESYKSPFKVSRERWRNRVFHSLLCVKNIVIQVQKAPRNLRVQFLHILSRHGTEAMFKPFLDAGIDVNEGHLWNNYLCASASNQNLPIFNLLVRAGASTALALRSFYTYSYIYDERPKNLFQIILQENNPFTFKDNLDNPFKFRGILEDPFKYRNNLSENDDPFMDLMISLAGREFPQAPRILFDRQVFRQEALYGGHDVHISRCYMYNAIKYNRPEIVELCLKHGFQTNGLIGEAWNCPIAHYGQLHSYNWLTAAVEFGRASCVDVLVKYGANVDLPDGTDTTALQLARAHVEGKHPRIHSSLELVTTSEDRAIFATLAEATGLYMSRELVAAPEDKAILVTLDQASAIIHKDRVKAMVRVGEVQYQDEIRNKPNENEASITQTLGKLEVAHFFMLCLISAKKLLYHTIIPVFIQKPALRLRYGVHDWEEVQNCKDLYSLLHSLSFCDALFMRAAYVASYIILLLYKIRDTIVWVQNMPKPPGIPSSTLAFAILVIIAIWVKI